MPQRALAKVTPIALGLFFLFGTAAAGAAALTLFWPGTLVDAVWRIKPDEFLTLRALGWPVAAGFLALALICLLTAVGCFGRRKWGWWLALVLIGVNLASDTVALIVTRSLDQAVGVLIASLILVWLLQPPVRQQFA